MKAQLVWAYEDGKPAELQEMSVFWFSVLALGDALTAVPGLRTLGAHIWAAAYDHAVTVWESEAS